MNTMRNLLIPVIIFVFSGCAAPAIHKPQLQTAQAIQPTQVCHTAKVQTTASGWMRWFFGLSTHVETEVTCELHRSTQP